MVGQLPPPPGAGRHRGEAFVGADPRAVGERVPQPVAKEAPARRRPHPFPARTPGAEPGDLRAQRGHDLDLRLPRPQEVEVEAVPMLHAMLGHGT